MRWLLRVSRVAAVLAALGCQQDEEASGPEPPPIPPPGPHFTYLPIPLATIARITPLGYNNKQAPNNEPYWLTCDDFIILQGTRPCHEEHQQVIAPANGVVVAVEPGPDGTVAMEGPPGLSYRFAHVTPAADLAPGSPVVAGQVVGTMFNPRSLNFGMHNNGVEQYVVVPERYPEPYRHAQNPIEQYPEPLRSELLARVNSVSHPLGRMAYDVPGTASGGWFIPGAPRTNAPFVHGNEYMFLFLVRYAEREETRIASAGDPWAGWTWGFLAAVDPAAPDWEAITPTSGAVALPLWLLGLDAHPDSAQPAGTLLVQLTNPTTLRVEWFDTHDPVTAFTAAARTYER